MNWNYMQPVTIHFGAGKLAQLPEEIRGLGKTRGILITSPYQIGGLLDDLCCILDQLRCTRVVIAQRLSTIRHCDRIIVLDKGKIAEQGTYEELMEQKGLFYEMTLRQL